MSTTESRSNLAKGFLTYGATALCLALGLWYAYAHAHELAVLRRIRPVQVLGLTAGMLVFFAATGFTFKLLLETVSIRLHTLEWLALTFLGNFANYILPTRPGAAIKAIYLKSTHTVPYARFSAVLMANGFLMLFTAGTVGFFLLLAMWMMERFFSLVLAGICLVMVGVSVVPAVIRIGSLFRLPSEGRFSRIFLEAFSGFETIRSRNVLLMAVSASMLSQYLVGAAIFTAAYRILGFDISFYVALMVGVFTSISNFFTVTPNNLGIQEVIIAYLYTTVGMDFTSGLIGAGLVRAIHIAVTFSLTPILTYALLGSAGMRLSTILPRRGDTH